MTAKNKHKYKALLLDLDGTLLALDIEQFIPAYIDALSRRFKELVNKELFVRHMILIKTMKLFFTKNSADAPA